MTESAFLFDHHRERALAALDDACPQASIGLDLRDTSTPQRFHMDEYIG
jgi:hypothetical protein